MIEIKSPTHTLRLFAGHLQWSDVFRVVMYCSYRGDKSRIPFFYSIDKGASCETDLRPSLTEIMAKMKSNTRNEIRRAEREECRFAIDDGFDEFIPFYNAFCDSKGYGDHVSRARLSKFKNILVTRVVCGDDTLAMHVTQLDPTGKIAILVLSGSQRLGKGVNTKLIGWGNRYLHFKELEWLKEHGYETYDWSGVCLDPHNPQHTIGQFKLSFGGTLVESWTLKSPLYAFLEKTRDLFRRLRNKWYSLRMQGRI